MMKMNRLPAPQWLLIKYKTWGKEWEAKLADDPKANFSWKQSDKQGYKELVEQLQQATQYHCAFCDNAPLRAPDLEPTIEHFRPKKKYPLLAYTWINLFPCCRWCQRKKDEFDKRLLKPDQINYSFDHYFEFDNFSGEVNPNSLATTKDQERAEITIKLYKLNDFGRPDARLRELNRFEDQMNSQIDKNSYSYRFILY